MNFITDLSSNKRKKIIYDTILIIIDRYIKIIKYFFIIKKINAIQLLNLFYKKIVLKYDTFNDIIINRNFFFTSAF